MKFLKKLFVKRRRSRDITHDDSTNDNEVSSSSDGPSLSSVQRLFPGNNFQGLRVLHNPPNPVVDIVFLHGLTGRPDKTFLHKETKTYWPVDLLPSTIPRGRIITFGYDADVAKLLGPVGQNTIQDHASNLVNDLARTRDSNSSTPRKIIFVTHSLGGLVTKRAIALSESYADAHLRQVEKDIVGIAFLGTPHRGAGSASFASAISKIAQASGKRVNTNILEVLNRDAEVLAAVEDSFANWCRRNEGNFQMTCFSEELELPGVGLVVGKESAKIGAWPQMSIHANHMDMTKFSSFEDDGYKRVSGELLRWTKPLLDNAEHILPDDHQRGIESALSTRINRAFIQQSDVLHASKPPKSADEMLSEPNIEETVEWFTKSPEFRAWKEKADLALLWLHGIPKDGKTVLMSYMTKHLPQYFEYTKRWDAATIFCSSDSSEVGLLMSLATQLSKDIDRARAAWRNIKSWPNSLNQEEVRNHLWRLLEILIAAEEVSAHETIFLIDGINELNSETRAVFIKNLVALEKKASLSTTVRILVSSRDYPDIREALSHYMSIERGKERKECLKSLFFEEWNARETRIESMDGGDWLSTHETYRKWKKDANSHFLWLEGKPGSGKSTLAKRVARTIREERPRPTGLHPPRVERPVATNFDSFGDWNTIVAEFHYSFRGGITETSHELMLRSIVYQIWSQNERLFPLIRDQYRYLKRQSNVNEETEVIWKYDDLEKVLQSLYETGFPLRVFIIVDGMDESDYGRRDSVLLLLLELSNRTSDCVIKILVSCRPETSINERLRHASHVVLQKENAEDIRKLVDEGISELQSLGQDREEATDSSVQKQFGSLEKFARIKAYIVDNSQGVFLWVSLVLKDLCRLVQRGGYRMSQLEKQLFKLPTELGGRDGFYRSIIENLIKSEERYGSLDATERGEELLYARRMLFWATFPKRPISIDELSDVLATPTHPSNMDDSAYDLEQSRPQGLQRGLLSYCGGLLEVAGDTRTVQLIHQTVREFLLDRDKLAEPYELDELHGDQEIAMTCYSYMRLAFSAAICHSEARNDALQIERVIEHLSQWILLEYCLTHFTAHLKQSAGGGWSIFEELKTFIEALNSRPTSYASLLLSRWISSRWIEISGFESIEMVSGEAKSKDCLQSVLVSAAGLGKDEVVRILLLLRADINGLNRDNVNALNEAARGCQLSTVRLLLDHSADPNAQGGHYGSALQAASSGGHFEVIRILLDRGADVNAQGGYYGSALQAASSGGHLEVIRILLDSGADANAQGGHYGSALQAASSGGHFEVIRILLDRGADPNAQGGHYGSALQAASSGGHFEVIRILLDCGADVNAQGGYYGSALQADLSAGYEQFVRKLLRCGAEQSSTHKG